VVIEEMTEEAVAAIVAVETVAVAAVEEDNHQQRKTTINIRKARFNNRQLFQIRIQCYSQKEQNIGKPKKEESGKLLNVVLPFLSVHLV
jgi:hypothetical protein